MKPTSFFWCAAAVAACANVTPPNQDQEPRLDQARALLTADPVRALEAVDAILADHPNWREARLVAAEGALRAAQSGRSRSEHLHDAIRNFGLALDGADDADHPLALQMLAECHYELGDFEDARTTALRAGRAFGATPTPEHRVGAANALLLAGRCDLQRFVAVRQAELEGGTRDARGKIEFGRESAHLASRAAACFEEAARDLPGEATTQMAMLHQWLEQPAAVMRVLEQGMRSAPDATAIHDAYIAWMRENGHVEELVGAYSQLVREKPDTPILRWHQGRALFTRADVLRSDGNFQGAIAAYGKADGVFADYLAMMPAHAGAAGQWRALCHLSVARCAVDMGDLAGAEKALVAASDASPQALAYPDGKPALADSFGNHFQAALFAVHAAWTESSDDALGKALAFAERALQRWPDRWAFLYNNAALAARDLGVGKAQRGDAAAAQELWERSYRHYERAIELAPDDARMANDCGLMLIYHLHRDLDRAQALFERAIASGKRQLAELPADVDARDRERLEEAVGDAYQNLAVLAKEHRAQPFAAYRAFCEESVKYYPYQRREAAALLRNEGAADLASTARSAATTAAAPQGGAAEALKKRRADIDAKVAAQDFDAALTVLDEIGKDCKDHAPYQALRGEITLKLAAQARDAGRRGVDLLFQDAVSALKRAVELDSEPVPPRQMLAQAQYDSGDTDAASRTLTGLLLHLQSQGGGKPDELLALHTLRANAAARAYAQKKGANEDDKELLTQARSSFRFAEEKGQLDNALLTLWSTTEQWAGAPAEAVNVYVRALKKAPEDQALLGSLVKVAYDHGQLPLAVDALARREDAIGLWFLGEARFWLADVQRQGDKKKDALTTLDAAHQAFAASMQKNAAYKENCEQRLAWCLGKKGCVAFRTDDLANAEKWLLESVRARPDQITADLGTTDTTKVGVMLVADKHFRAGNLAKTEAIYRAASDAAHGDLDFLNNSGLFARDHGNQLEAAGKKDEAMAMYEQSYKAYSRAAELDPASVRLRNDVALIAIWHLERDWDLSKQRLDSAIADGEKTLRDNPPDAREKEVLEEAVGDCLENLALWHLKHSKDATAAKAAAEKSMQFHPKQRRGNAQRHLRNAERLLQGK